MPLSIAFEEIANRSGTDEDWYGWCAMISPGIPESASKSSDIIFITGSFLPLYYRDRLFPP
jgi:hypothetical protein